ncbi:hypothetical protein [Shimia ponticola]|uniref:hypothetical protein n=1 Tax=Shimia ponticola TaxID=2582893 RepID=UPI0011BFA2AE|nr:hypothetical protein [Shimia ponticola]
MGLGNMLGGLLGNAAMDQVTAKLGDLGIDASALEGLDIPAVIELVQEKGFDLSMLEELGISVEDVVAKLTGGDA